MRILGKVDKPCKTVVENHNAENAEQCELAGAEMYFCTMHIVGMSHVSALD